MRVPFLGLCLCKIYLSFWIGIICSLDKALDFFKALKLCKSYFNFLNRRKEFKAATYNIVSVYTWHILCVNYLVVNEYDAHFPLRKFEQR